MEEAICGAFSLWILDATADNWALTPPYQNWRDYAPFFRTYMLKESKSYGFIIEDKPIASWYIENEGELRACKHLTSVNKLLSNYFYTKVFQHSLKKWKAIRYLNLGGMTESDSLEEYFRNWRSHCSLEQMTTVEEIAAQFGYRIAYTKTV